MDYIVKSQWNLLHEEVEKMMNGHHQCNDITNHSFNQWRQEIVQSDIFLILTCVCVCVCVCGGGLIHLIATNAQHTECL